MREEEKDMLTPHAAKKRREIYCKKVRRGKFFGKPSAERIIHAHGFHLRVVRLSMNIFGVGNLFSNAVSAGDGHSDALS
ncbi:hypothetical protein AXF15_06600 [Desulfomicrobium orale DSM 12838]|uniref:Uncharacterized protein n=1 Tax=Desulfomicrobium orale DSM 12838 TaxID=888061 RepID=A0A0X8JPX7_9BACT|nr:hypothetical protein AXF15_06600 [Desulfomicrobium orale DSM 12838]